MANGTQGYDLIGPEKLAGWDAIPVQSAPAAVLKLLEAPPGCALDVGAGSGRVSAWLAARGWRVDAVEPMAAFREHALRVHGDAARWLDGALPALEPIEASTYDLITCFAVLASGRDRARGFASPVRRASEAGRGACTLAADWRRTCRAPALRTRSRTVCGGRPRLRADAHVRDRSGVGPDLEPRRRRTLAVAGVSGIGLARLCALPPCPRPVYPAFNDKTRIREAH